MHMGLCFVIYFSICKSWGIIYSSCSIYFCVVNILCVCVCVVKIYEIRWHGGSRVIPQLTVMRKLIMMKTCWASLVVQATKFLMRNSKHFFNLNLWNNFKFMSNPKSYITHAVLINNLDQSCKFLTFGQFLSRKLLLIIMICSL